MSNGVKSVQLIANQRLPNKRQTNFAKMIHNQLIEMRKQALETNLVEASELFDLEFDYILKRQRIELMEKSHSHIGMIFIVIATICVLIAAINYNCIEYLLGIRCLLPNNYLIWEATRPVSDCRFCAGIQSPIILFNVTREKFAVSISTCQKYCCHFD